jgi:hypothetical protein
VKSAAERDPADKGAAGWWHPYTGGMFLNLINLRNSLKNPLTYYSKLVEFFLAPDFGEARRTLKTRKLEPD